MPPTKHVYFCGKKVEKSPSPEPFKEPDGMTNIDLNSHDNIDGKQFFFSFAKLPIKILF